MPLLPQTHVLRNLHLGTRCPPSQLSIHTRKFFVLLLSLIVSPFDPNCLCFCLFFLTINSVSSGSISESTLCNPQQATYCRCLIMCSMQRHRMMWPEWGHAKLLTFVQASWLRFSLEDSHRYSCACRWVQAWSPQSSSEEEGNEWEVGDRTIRGSNEKTPEANKHGYVGIDPRWPSSGLPFHTLIL